MPTALLSILAFFAAALLFVVVVVAGWWIFVRVVRFIGAAVTHVWRWVAGSIADLLRIVGAAIVAVVFVPLALANIIIGRWSAAAHYGRALSAEFHTIGTALYRVAIGHPARLLGLARAVEGLERRLPHAVAEAPTSDKPRKASGIFEGYEIVGSLKGGGSGGKLYIAAPDAMKQAAFERRGFADCDRVVIKTFSLTDGSSLPQIVRESRALDAARKMGLVLEHQLSDERFFYVMRYVPGESLATVTQNLHAKSAPVPRGGLDDDRLRVGVGYVADLLEALDVYHTGGLWHKDVKPDNIIIDPRPTEGARAGGRAHLVDFGLITPLRSAMTLTTHGTEYFRDPELVRMALRGVKVHQIDGAKFDVYAAGAVLYSVIEAQFPAHGGLSRVEKRCPDALRWVIRRAMTDYDKRYPSARAMLADLETVLNAEDPFAVKPAELPSMKGVDPADDSPEAHDEVVAAVPLDPVEMPTPEPQSPYRAESPEPGATPAAAPAPRKIRVANWWTGKMTTEPVRPAPAADQTAPSRRRHRVHAPTPAAPRVAPENRAPAAEQLRHARERVTARRNSAKARVNARRNPRQPENKGLAAAVLTIFLVLAVAVGLGIVVAATQSEDTRQAEIAARAADEARARLEAFADADLETQLAETERQLKEALAEAGTTAKSGLESALAAIREARVSIGLTSPDRPAPPATPDNPRPLVARAPVAPAHVLPGGTLARPGARVAFLSDFRPPLDPALRAQANGVIGLLEGAGADVFGELTPRPADPREAGREIATIAELRRARASTPLDTHEAAERLQSAVTGNDEFDAVLWIAPAPEGNGRITLLIATPGQASIVEAATLHPGLLARYTLPAHNN